MDDIEAKKEFSEAPAPSGHPGWVYFVRAGRAIKIGYSIGVPSRLSTLQTGHYQELELLVQVPGSLRDERRYHFLFRAFKIRREWFRSCDPILAEVEHLKRYGKPSKKPIDAFKPEPKPERSPLLYSLDCKSRRAPNKTERMKIELRMAMIRDGTAAAFAARQDALLGVKPRIRVQAITSERHT